MGSKEPIENEPIEESPTGDVKYDQKAAEEAAQRMHATGDPEDDKAREEDPEGGHDPRALKDAAEKMAAERRD